MDIHLHGCAFFTTIKFMFHFFFVVMCKWLLKSQTEHPGLLLNGWTWRKHEITPQSDTKQSDKCTVIQMIFGATPPFPTASEYVL